MANTKTTPAIAGRRSREQWAVEVERWRSSGLGSAEYAAERGLKRGTLLWWSSRIGATKTDRSSSDSGAPVTFVPLRVRSEVDVEVDSGSSSLEVVLRNGRRLRIAGAVDAAELARVIAIVEGASPC